MIIYYIFILKFKKLNDKFSLIPIFLFNIMNNVMLSVFMLDFNV